MDYQMTTPSRSRYNNNNVIARTPQHHHQQGSSSSSSSSFIFPILKNSEILQCMSELGIELNNTEIKEPHRYKDKVRKVFLQMLDVCCGLSEDIDFSSCSDNNIAIFDKIDISSITEYKELYINDNNKQTTSIGSANPLIEIKFFKCIRKLMVTCGIYDFTLKDIFQPTTRRFKQQLSGLINMAKFREDQLRLYTELNEPRIELLEALEQVNEESEQLKEQYELTQNDNKEKNTIIKEILDDCNKLEMEVVRNNKIQSTKREETTLLKKQANDLKDLINEKMLIYDELQIEYKSLSNKIVSNDTSTEIKNKILELKNTIQGNRSNCIDVENKISLTNDKIQYIEKLIIDLDNIVIPIIKETSNEYNKYNDICNDIQSIKNDVINKNEILLKERQHNMNMLSNDINKLYDDISTNAKIYESNIQETTDNLTDKKSQLHEIEKENLHIKDTITINESKIQNKTKLLSNTIHNNNMELLLMISEYKKFEKQYIMSTSSPTQSS